MILYRIGALRRGARMTFLSSRRATTTPLHPAVRRPPVGHVVAPPHLHRPAGRRGAFGINSARPARMYNIIIYITKYNIDFV